MTASSWLPMPVVKGNLSSAGYMPSGLHETVPPPVDLLADRRGHTERVWRNWKDGSEYDSLYAARQPREGGLAGGHERQPCPGHRLRLVQQLDRTGADADARHDMQPLQGEPQFRIHTILAAACSPSMAARHTAASSIPRPLTTGRRQKPPTAVSLPILRRRLRRWSAGKPCNSRRCSTT